MADLAAPSAEWPISLPQPDTPDSSEEIVLALLAFKNEAIGGVVDDFLRTGKGERVPDRFTMRTPGTDGLTSISGPDNRSNKTNT